MNDEVDSTSRYDHFGCKQPGMPKVPKIRSLYIFAINTKVFYKLIVSLCV